MFPSPLDIPASVDCVLASTGSDATLPLIFGLVAVVLGITFFVFARGRLRGSAVALGLVLLLAGGTGLAVTAPASSASADDCTPRDYLIDGTISPDTSEPDTVVNSGQTVTITFWVANAADRDGQTPIVVRVPRQPSVTAVALDGASTNWALDSVTDPANYTFTYSGPLPKGTQSSDAVFTFTASNGNSSPVDVEIPVTIDSGSGGDSNDANNSVVLSVLVQGIVG